MVDGEFDFTPHLLAEIEVPFADIFRIGRFKLIEGSYYPQHFGNEILIFRSPKCGLKFVLDRSRISVDITGPPEIDEWLNLQDFLEMVLGREPNLEAISLGEQAQLLSQNFEAALDFLAPNEITTTKQSIEIIGRKTSDLRVAKYFRPSLPKL